MKNKVFIIAEAGDNHNGDLQKAYELIDKAVEAKADCVKFQTFKTENVVSKFAEKAEYQKANDGKNGSQFEMIKNLELPFEDFRRLKIYCDEKHIMFLSTAFDLESIDFLATLDLPIWKIPSGEITNLPYLEKIASLGKDVILSTGMCELDEVKAAINILKKNGCGEITILHCNTEYPTPFHDVNLRAMVAMRQELNVNIGYSDHTLGIEVPIAAVALGATVIEKHFTLDKNMVGPDHKASLEPDELKDMVRAVRNIEQAMGTDIKKVTNSERKNIVIARKSIVAKKAIKKGDILNENNMTIKRPGNGISPMHWYELIGKESPYNFEVDELIKL